jgi:hypothetical protein
MKVYAVDRIERIQHGKILRHVPQAGNCNRNKSHEA